MGMWVAWWDNLLDFMGAKCVFDDTPHDLKGRILKVKLLETGLADSCGTW